MKKCSWLLLSLLLLGSSACQKTTSNLPNIPASPSAPGPSPAKVHPSAAPGVSYGEVGNGGHGVMRNGKIYLVDLAEGGDEKTPFFETRTETSAVVSFKARLRKRLTDPNFDLSKLAMKLNDIYTVDPVLGVSLLETFDMYTWKIVDQDLQLLRLEGSILALKEGEVT